MGRPKIDIAFQKAAVTGIQQGTNGIIRVPFVNQAFTTQQATIKHRITMYSDIDNLPETYTYKSNGDIKPLLKQIWLGGVKEIVVLAFDKVKTKSAMMDELQNHNFDFLYTDCLVIDTPSSIQDIIAGTKDLNNTLGKMIFTIGQGLAGDHESILNIDPALENATNGSCSMLKEHLTARIAGEIAGLSLNLAPTYRVLSDIVDCTNFSGTTIDSAIDAGKITLINDGAKVKIARGVTSLVTQGTKPNGFKKIKVTRIYYKVKKEIMKTIIDYYVGQVDNGYMDKLNLITSIQGYLETLETIKLLDKGKNYIDINVTAQRNYLVSQGIDVSGMSEQEIREANTDDKVFLSGKIKALDSMEDIELVFNI